MDKTRNNIRGFIKISDVTDANNPEILVQKENAIHYENFSQALANSITNRTTGYIEEMHFGNGGTAVDSTGVITYLTPNNTGSNSSLYNQTYYKSINDLSSVILKFESEKFLLPSSDLLNPSIPKFLDDLNINWKRAELFKTVISDLSDLRNVYYDILVFFSPSGIESLFKNFPDFKQNETKIAVYGKTTIDAAKKAELRIDISAPNSESPSMTMAIENYIKINR